MNKDPNKNQPFVVKEGQNNEQGSLVIDGEFVPCNDEVKEPPKRRIVGKLKVYDASTANPKTSSNNNGAIDPVASLLTTQTQEERVLTTKKTEGSLGPNRSNTPNKTDSEIDPKISLITSQSDESKEASTTKDDEAILKYFEALNFFFTSKTGDIIPLDEALRKKVPSFLEKTTIENEDYAALFNEIKTKPYLYNFIHSSNTGTNSRSRNEPSLESTANKLFIAKESSECDPYEALAFVDLCNANIDNLYHNRKAHTRMRFLQSELGSLQNTILISVVGLGCYMLTMFHCIPNMLGIAFMATIGLIGLISAEQIILRPTNLLNKNPDKAYACIILNIVLTLCASILTLTVNAPIIASIGLLGTLAPLMAILLHQKLILSAISNRPVADEDTSEVTEVLHDYKLDGVFHIKANQQVDIGPEATDASTCKC